MNINRELRNFIDHYGLYETQEALKDYETMENDKASKKEEFRELLKDKDCEYNKYELSEWYADTYRN